MGRGTACPTPACTRRPAARSPRTGVRARRLQVIRNVRRTGGTLLLNAQGRRAYPPTLILIGLLFLAVSASLSFGTSLASQLRKLPPIHQLRGISAIHLNVSGLPKAIGESAVSESSITQAIRQRILDAGIDLPSSSVREIPTLRIRVLAPRTESQYAFMITIELLEQCEIKRRIGPEPFCSTWSIYPRIGFFKVGRELHLERMVINAADQFLDAWRHDNNGE